MKKTFIYILAGITLIVSFSCKKYFTVEPQGYIPAEENFKNADDAVSAIYGLYSLMQPLVDQIFLAGEVQSDLVVEARGADGYLSEIAQNRITSQNPYTDYTNFYKLIVACNNTISGLEKLSRVDPINYTAERYNYNIAEVAYIRAWTYLQLVKIWGDVPYIEHTVTTVDQLTDNPPVQADIILENIEKDALKYYSIMLLANPVSNPGAGLNIAGSEIRILRGQFNSFAAQCLLGEIYVYRGNYSKAKDILGGLVPFGNASNGNVGVFGITTYDYSNYWQVFRSMSTGEANDGRALYIDFDGSRGQTNNLQRWTSNSIREGGSFAFKPSSVALKKWNETDNMLLKYQNTSLGYFVNPAMTDGSTEATQPVLLSNGNPMVGGKGDYIRGPGVSYQPVGKDTLIFKYLMKERGVIKNSLQNDNNSKNDAMFIVYRDGPMYLLMCEIYNTLGFSNQALAMLNGGVTNSGYRGTRYRARVMPFELKVGGGDIKKQVDMMILEEKALEGAFEGIRWFDLVRMAKKWNDPSILADIVAKKYPAGKQAAIRAYLMDEKHWYFPYYQRNVIANKLLQQP
ncbi:MAG: RagB/SusD family nutrient uptake outer membrane protein [Sphingobacteriales bacterium]|nr:RagB/SusD family nutrient uptake outer membrane protein [Sphingobacteriales bacterium]